MQFCLQYSQLGVGKYICREHMILSTTHNYTLLFAVRIITNEATANQISFKYQYKKVKRNDEN